MGGLQCQCRFSEEKFTLHFNRAIVDVPTDHPSCSKQHAVLQCAPCPNIHNDFCLLRAFSLAGTAFMSLKL
jgi:hypothetical protein